MHKLTILKHELNAGGKDLDLMVSSQVVDIMNPKPYVVTLTYIYENDTENKQHKDVWAVSALNCAQAESFVIEWNNKFEAEHKPRYEVWSTKQYVSCVAVEAPIGIMFSK